MVFEFDPAKSARNARERGLPFDLVNEIEWDKALTYLDRRFAYGEERVIAIAPRAGRLHVICYVLRQESRRIISFRKANKREIDAYERAIANE